MCDSLAKSALRRGLEEGYHDKTNMLPRKLTAVIFDVGKASLDRGIPPPLIWRYGGP